MHCGDTYPDFDVAHVCSKGPYAPKLKPKMNKRLKELALEAGYTPDMFGVGHWDMPECKKFAELIVRECAKVAVFKDSGTVATANVAGYMAAGRSTAARLIKEHFGVEE